VSAVQRTSGLASVAAAATGVQVGAAMVASRFALQQLGPAGLALLRYGLALALVAPVALASVRRRWAPRDLAPVALLGVLQFGVVILLLNLALLRIPSGLAALLFTTAPLQALALAVLMRRERATWPKAIGALAAVAGVGLALGAPLPSASGTSVALAVLAALGSAFAAALCSVLYRPYVDRYPVPQVGALAMAASVVALAGPAAAEGLAGAAQRAGAATWWAVAFVGASSGVGYLLWLWALGRAAASRVTLFLALGPIVALLLGAVFLGETLSRGALVGTALVALGLAIAHRGGAAAGTVTP